MGRILVIDDAQFARMVLRTMLEDNGYEICGEAENGKEGLEKYKELKPDLVFCDIRMNEMDGVDCLKAILEEDPAAKVVICAAISDKARIPEFMEAGARGYVEKPVYVQELIRVTEELIGDAEGHMPFKKLMEKQVEEAGIEKKALLDFFAAFRSITGFDLDDPKVDGQYMKDFGEGLLIGIRALLAAKTADEQVDQLEKIFLELIPGN